MIKVKVDNAKAFFDAIDRWLADVEYLIVQVAVGLAYKAFDVALTTSPQYSGDFVANWKMSVGQPNVSFQPGIFPEMTYPVDKDKRPFQRGDTAAIMHAITASNGVLSGAKLGDTLWLANSAEHDDLYAWKIEDNLIRFRPVNFGGDGPLRQVREVLKASYTEIGKHNVNELL